MILKKLTQSKQWHLLIMLFLCAAIVSGMSSISTSSQQQNDLLKVFEEIGEAYKNGGKERLSLWMKKNKDRVNPLIIKGIVNFGIQRRVTEFFEIAIVLAEEKNDTDILAVVYLKASEYYRLISEYDMAWDYLEKAFSIYKEKNDPKGQGNVYMGKGVLYLKMGNQSKALEMYEKALNLFGKIGYLQGQGDIFFKKGEIYLKAGENANALSMYKKALPLFEKLGDVARLYDTYMRMVKIYYESGNQSRALEVLDNAQYYFENVKDPIEQGNAYHKKGEIYYKNGDLKQALEMYEKSMPFYLQAGDSLGIGNVYFNKGRVFLEKGNRAKALEMFRLALNYYEKINEPNSLGNLYVKRGEIYAYTSNHVQALEMYKKALSFYEKSGMSPLGKGSVCKSIGEMYSLIGNNNRAFEMYEKALIFFEKAKDLTGMGAVYRDLGDIYLRINNHLHALEMYKKALFYFEKKDEPLGLGSVYRGKGDVFFYIGSKPRALTMYKKALSYYEKTKNLRGLGNVYLKLGNLYFSDKNYTNALTMYKKALIFYEKREEQLGIGNVYFGMSSIHIETKEYTRAIDNLEKANTFYITSGNKLGQANVYHAWGNALNHLGRFDAAKKMLEEAVSRYEAVGVVDSKAYALFQLAAVSRNLGKNNEALECIEKGFLNLEKSRFHAAIPHMKQVFMEKVYDFYEEAVLFMIKNKYYQKAFKYIESMKARVFLDQLAEGIVKLDKGITPALKQKRDHLIEALSILSKHMNTAPGNKDKNKMEELKEQHQKVMKEFEDLLVEIRLNNPLYASVSYPEPVSLQHLQTNILKEAEVLLRYFIARNEVHVFLISKDGFYPVKLEVEAKEMKRLLNRYSLSIKENDGERTAKYGKWFYQFMFKPFEKWIKGKRELIIVPDSQLAAIPFESFVIDDTKPDRPIYLLEKYRVNYIQSASALSILRKHYHREGKTAHFVGFGDPVYDYENFKQGKPERGIPDPDPAKGDEIKEIHRGKYDREGGIYHRLPGSGQEVEAIAELFKKQVQKSIVYLRERANEGNAKAADMKEYDYIHFSCHGILGDGFQSLLLSQIPMAKEDGYLTLNELMNCDYHAKLVVLSACQTGSGKMERAEGVMGLTRAVMYAGTPCAVVSLWNVSEMGTKELMVKFYKKMLEKKMSKEEALRQAKLEMIKEGKYSSPYFWSAFVMYGE